MNARPLVTRLCVLTALVLLAAACGGGETKLQMGLKRVALDLAFKADDKTPQQRVRALPPVVQTDFSLTAGNQLVVRAAPRSLLLPVSGACASAARGAVPTQPATVTIPRPPVAGLYPTHNQGTLNVQAGTLRFQGPYPRHGRIEIANVTDKTAPPDDLVEPGARTIEFTHVLPLGNTTTTTRYRVTGTELLLVQRQIKTADGEFSFTPTPPITMMSLDEGEGTTWSSAGTDLNTGATMVVQGVIVKRESVDLCGEVYDTYRVQSTERLAQLSGSGTFTQMTSDASNPDGKPNVYNIATQFGALFLRTETHMTTTTSSLIVDEDNVSTFDALTPVPAPAAG